MATTVELKVRFNPEAQQIEVVANEELIGFVERDVWSQWPFELKEEQVREVADEVVDDKNEVTEESEATAEADAE